MKERALVDQHRCQQRSSGGLRRDVFAATPQVAHNFQGERDEFMQYLTPADFELVYQATGVRIDKDSVVVPTFAAQIGHDRKNGMFPGGQPVDAAYLKDLADQYRGKGDWMSEQADLALAYLTTG